MHVGGDRTGSDQAHLSILENGDEAVRIKLGLEPGRFQVPVWSSDGSHFFYVAENSDGVESIYKTNADTLEQQPLTDVSGVSFMTLSPDDQQLAYLQIEGNDGVPFGSAYIVNTDGTQLRLLTDRLVGSMYWSPDGSKLAVLTADIDKKTRPTAKIDGLALPLREKPEKYLRFTKGMESDSFCSLNALAGFSSEKPRSEYSRSPRNLFRGFSRQQVTFRWWIYDLETKEFAPLISFNPTSDFFQTIPFFDQYHLSLTFWSPDSRYFVVTKRGDEGPDGTVWVLDTTGQEEPQQIGEGRLAVWSWQ